MNPESNIPIISPSDRIRQLNEIDNASDDEAFDMGVMDKWLM